MDDKKVTLYIPLGVKTETELFPGFGKKQLMQAAIGSLAFAFIAFILYLISNNVSLTIITLLTGIAGSVMMTATDPTNLSVLDQFRNMTRFAKSQKYYPYRYGNEWDVF